MRLSSTIPTHDIDPVEGAEGIVAMGPASAQIRLWHGQMQRDMGAISGNQLAVLERLAGRVAGQSHTMFNPYTGEVRKAFLPDWVSKRRDHEPPMAGWTPRQSSVEERYFADMQLLLDGDYEQGFARYENRWKVRFNAPHARSYDRPQWTGQSLDGRTVYLWHEQGYGDTIMMHRYLPLVEAMAKQVHLELPPPLIRLFEQNSAQRHVEGTLDEWDYHCPMMSMPFAFKTTLDSIPPPSLKAESFCRYGDVLLCWAGRLQSIPLVQMLELADIASLTFFSAQYALAKDEEETLAERGLANIAPRDFAELASIIADTRLVVTVDTAMAHLAGSLGKPVFIILPRLNDWRWLRGGDSTPWYQSARLFRQRSSDWRAVLDEVFDAISVFAGLLDGSRDANARGAGSLRNEAGSTASHS